jgi:predicted nucleic acid-binding protein
VGDPHGQDASLADARSRRGTQQSPSSIDSNARGWNIAFVSEELEAQALRWLRRHDEREYSFVDATSFAPMRSLRVKRAFAFDGDFAAAGFTELRA